MGERKWTPMQIRAIQTRDRTLLVSAAAGSGKTATLTERIISSVLDEEKPENIEEMLIVTFTNAAVGELKQRIAKAIKDRLSLEPDNQRLKRQLLMLPGAKILTIDAFCSEILRANCELVGVSPTYRIADGAESELLAEGVLDGLISAVYEGLLPEVATPTELENLSDCLTDTRSEGDLALILRLLYKQLESTEAGVDTLEGLIEQFNPKFYSSFEKTKMGQYLFERVRGISSHYLKILEPIRDEILAISDPKLYKVFDIIESDISILRAFLKEKSYDALRYVFLNMSLQKSVSPGKQYSDTLPPITAIRAEMKAEISALAENVFCFSDKDILHSYRGLYESLSVLYRLLKRFDSLYTEEKLRRGICDYSDVERFTYKCLWRDGKKTDVARAEAEKYTSVYIDEYQDVNSLQNKIFEAISKENNRFMVGDIKQSIYGFRSANPEIFASMKKSFPKLDSAGDYPSASIFMSENFRSDRAIIDYINAVFDRLFGFAGESIGYEAADRLNAAKIHSSGEPEYLRPTLCIIDKAQRYVLRGESEGEADEGNKLSPVLVAKKIEELLASATLDNGQRVTPSDIAIIIRNSKGKDIAYASALRELGIPSMVAEEKSFFMNSEILLALCLLNSIDNPRKDIYLAGLMRSPLFSFSADELAQIRHFKKDGALYDALLEYTRANDGYTRGENFIKTLEKYRTLAEGLAVDALLLRLYHETGLLALASANGTRENLLLFYEHARRFERSSYKGLYNFISYINSVLERKNEFDERQAPVDSDAVKIITAHSSKGLEYPIVFFVGAEQRLKSPRDSQANIVLDNEFGIGMFLRTPKGYARVENPTKYLVLDYKHRKRVEEEMRLLYVALSRARERLYIVAEPNKKYNEVIDRLQLLHEYLDGVSVYGLSSYLDMLAAAVGCAHCTEQDFLANPCNITEREFKAEPEVQIQTDKEQGEDTEALIDELYRRFTYKYQNEHITRLPEKMSVSRLYPEILDGEDTDGDTDSFRAGLNGNSSHGLPSYKTGITPKFYNGLDGKISAKRGIATHLLFQFFDIDKLIKNGVESELRRLLDMGYITAKDKELVRIPEAELFRKSELIQRMKKAKNLYREFRFTVNLPAGLFTAEDGMKEKYKDSEILVQGVIDCLIEDEDGRISLIDYKTDRLTDEEKADISKATEKLRRAHKTQLLYYSEAVKRIFGKDVSTVEIYSLPLGRTVEI